MRTENWPASIRQEGRKQDESLISKSGGSFAVPSFCVGIWRIGHGGGAQWVQRYVLHSGGRYIERAVAANPGWYMLPDDEFSYPYGIKGTPISPATLRGAFATDFVLLLGQADVQTGGVMRNNRETSAQGKTRFERGHFYFNRAAADAKRMGAKFGWHLREVPGAGHEDEDMAPPAAEALMERG